MPQHLEPAKVSTLWPSWAEHEIGRLANQRDELREALEALAFAVSPSAHYREGTMTLGESIDWDDDSMESYFKMPMRQARRALANLNKTDG